MHSPSITIGRPPWIGVTPGILSIAVRPPLMRSSHIAVERRVSALVRPFSNAMREFAGVANVTPDSFSDGGRFFAPEAAASHARRLAQEGAEIIDIGGESSRPGAAPVSEREELERILPVLERIADLCVSVDTRRPAGMKAALAAGASMINDIQALAEPYALEAVAGLGCVSCLIHMRAHPATMQREPQY